MTPKITYADLSKGPNVTAEPSLVQWNRGNRLNVSGVDLPASYKVEFSNKGDKATIPAIACSDSIEIPNALLETGRPIIAYVVMVWDDGRSTEAWITINVKPRPEPEDEVPDPGQQSEVEQLLAALNNGVERAEDAAGNAEESEDNSEENAKIAKSWAVGGTGSRTGEDTDNAKFYSEAAQQAASINGWVKFYIDENGHLHYVKTANTALRFYLKNGHLHVTNA